MSLRENKKLVPYSSMDSILMFKKNKVEYFKNEIDFELIQILMPLCIISTIFMSIALVSEFNLGLFLSLILSIVLSSLFSITMFLLSYIFATWREKSIFKSFKSKDKIELYEEILNMVEVKAVKENLKIIVEIAFLNKIGFEIKEYIDERLGDNSYIKNFFNSKDILEIYLNSLSDKEKLSFYRDKEMQLKINNNFGNEVLFNFNKEYVLPSAKKHIGNNSNNKEESVNQIIRDLNTHSSYKEMLEDKLSIAENGEDLLEKLNRNTKNVVF